MSKLLLFFLLFAILFPGACIKQEDEHAAREKMVSHQIAGRGVSDELVLAAMREVPRHRFVPGEMRPYAYVDRLLSVGEDQIIPPPYIVALMAELLGLKGGERLLEIGVDSGYQAAVLAEIAAEVYAVEATESLARSAEEALRETGYKNITVKCGDEYMGWEEHAPFDGVILTAAPDHIPQPLVDQLKVGGKMVIPEGASFQELKLLTKTEDGVKVDERVLARERMVYRQIVSAPDRRCVSDKLVVAAMRKVPRHEFVSEKMKPYAYEDTPLPIEEEQTISQPYIVALMTELLGLKGGEKVLEIGTGSGYQAAILAEIAAEVYTIEIIEFLAKTAEERLQKMGYKNITVKWGDGYQGWKEHAPFDAVIVTAAPDHIPQPLVDQLRIGGRMVIPVGSYFQKLELLTKTEDGVKRKNVIPVSFVPMTGEAQEK